MYSHEFEASKNLTSDFFLYQKMYRHVAFRGHSSTEKESWRWGGESQKSEIPTREGVASDLPSCGDLSGVRQRRGRKMVRPQSVDAAINLPARTCHSKGTYNCTSKIHSELPPHKRSSHRAFLFWVTRGLACKAKGNLSPKDTQPVEGVETQNPSLFFILPW